MEAQALYKRFAKFLKYRRWIAGLLAGGLLVNKGLCHVFPQNLFMPFHAELETDKFSYNQMINMFRTSLKDTDLKEPVHPFITTQPFSVYAGLSGMKQYKQMPTVGIPKHYLCNNVFEVEDLKIKLDRSGRIIDSQGGPNEWAFLESLLFSEASKKFDISRCLLIIKENWLVGQVFLAPVFVLLGYLACFPAYQLLFKGKKISFGHLLKWQIGCILITWLMYVFAQKYYKYLMKKSVDLQAASFSKEYAQGAVDYCKNIRKTNKAMRVLLGKKGEKMFTDDGDYASAFRLFLNNNEPSLNTRQKQFENILKSF